MSNENNNEYNEVRDAHDGQSGHGAKRPYNRQKNYKYKPQHRNSYNRKQTSDRKRAAIACRSSPSYYSTQSLNDNLLYNKLVDCLNQCFRIFSVCLQLDRL